MGFSLNDIMFVPCDHELTFNKLSNVHGKNIFQTPLVKYFDFFPKIFFPKFDLPNLGCSLSESVAKFSD